MSESETKPNSVQQFYAGKTIFITGASGFMGKVLIEKLLFSCSDVKELIILMRPKRGKSGQQRVDEFSKLPLFQRIMDQNPNVMNKIFPVIGEITKPNFDLNFDHFKRVTETAEIVYHLAASLKLEATLKPNIIMNLVGTKNTLDLAKQMKNLIQIVHLSTAFCNIEPEIVDEKVYDYHHKPEDLIRCAEWMSEEAMAELQKEILGVHQNTYTYTKRLAEILVRNEYKNLPLSIVRPSIVTPAIYEPLDGWVDSLNGPIGIIYGAAKGVLRSMLVDPNGMFEMIPVDTAIAALILIAKDLATRAERPSELPVYHLSIHKSRQITYKQLLDRCKVVGTDYPFSWALWFPDGDITQSVLIHKLKVFFFQLVPAHFIDFLLLIFRQKRFLVHVQDRIAVGCEVIHFFSNRKWNFKADSFHALVDVLTPDEYYMFLIDTLKLGDEAAYIKSCILGARQYCVKDPLSTLPNARLQYKIQYLIHVLCKYLFWYFIVKFTLKLFGFYEPMTDFLGNYIAGFKFLSLSTRT